MRFRLADGVDELVAESRATGRVRAMAEGQLEAETYALELMHFEDIAAAGRPHLATGVGYIVYATELAMIVGDDLRGVAPSSFDRRTLAMLMRTRLPAGPDLRLATRRAPIYADRFFDIALAAVKLERQEGNG